MNTANQVKAERISRKTTEFCLIEAIIEHFFMSESYIKSQKLKKHMLNSIFNLNLSDLLKALATSTNAKVIRFVQAFSTLDNKLQNDVFTSLKQHKQQLIFTANIYLELKGIYSSDQIKMIAASSSIKISLSNYT